LEFLAYKETLGRAGALNLIRYPDSPLIDARAIRVATCRQNNYTESCDMTHRLSLRLWIETALGVVSAVAFMMTLIMPDWIERIFGFEPDGGDGSTEWGLAISLAIATLVLLVDAHRLRSRSAQASVPTK
jgi:hypothetical protein